MPFSSSASEASSSLSSSVGLSEEGESDEEEDDDEEERTSLTSDELGLGHVEEEAVESGKILLRLLIRSAFHVALRASSICVISGVTPDRQQLAQWLS